MEKPEQPDHKMVYSFEMQYGVDLEGTYLISHLNLVDNTIPVPFILFLLMMHLDELITKIEKGEINLTEEEVVALIPTIKFGPN